MSTHHPETFGAILRRHRRAVGLSQEGLAERSGLSVRRIGELERRPKTQPYRETVRLLAEALDLSEEERAQLEYAARTMRRPLSPLVGVAAPDPFSLAASYEHNLPPQPTSFIGRERGVEVARATLLRQDVRLLTLTGPGGAGKTRLAIRAAESVIGHFRNGVWFVDLAPIASPEFVASATARALGVKEVPGQPLETILSNHLRDEQLLLVLDNFEQILGAAPMIAELLSSAPLLKVLVTSRVVLHLRAEQVYLVPPLELPRRELPSSHEDLKECEAVRLFIERARAAGGDGTFDGEDATAVAEICMRLEGLPLAIELAAARTRAFPPKALLSRLDRRLDLLTGGPRERTVGDEWLIARGAYGVAWTALALGELGKARAHYAESLRFLIGTDDRWGIAVVLEGPAGDGEVVRAAQLTGAASVIRDEIGGDNLLTDRSHSQRLLDAARERLGERRWKAARDEGRAMPRDRVLGFALGTDTGI